MAGQKNKANKTYNLSLLLKYQLIEIIALWEGRLTATHLVNAFDIGRQQGSKIIDRYKKDVSSNNLLYDKHLKGNKPTKNFKPVVTNGSFDEYMQLLNSKNDLSSHLNYLKIGITHTEVIFSPARYIVPENIRPIIAAIHNHDRLDIQYSSFTSSTDEGRVITPHSLVYSGYRWHVRAHCEKNNDYRDFVLSRISSIPEPVSLSERGIEGDEAWNHKIILRIMPDPRLSEFQQSIIARDYNMQNQVLEITTRAALANYYLQYLRMTPSLPEQSPEAQQLVLDNYDQVKNYLF